MSVKVIYILGYGRSGSTVLNALLAHHPDITGVGELVNLPEQGWLQDGYCACGKRTSACEFWSDVTKTWSGRSAIPSPAEYWRHHRRYQGYAKGVWLGSRLSQPDQAYLNATESLLESIVSASGNTVLVDSSKVPSWLLTLAQIPEIDLRVVHLIRDGRSTLNSLRQGYRRSDEDGIQHDIPPRPGWQSSLSWSISNLLCELAALRGGLSLCRLRYEELLEAPAMALQRVGRHAELDLSPVIDHILSDGVFNAGCAIAGNRLRMQPEITFLSHHGSPPSLSHFEACCYWLLAGWASLRYGYHPWARWRTPHK